ncbi:MAG TPA: hypothetical protein VFG68_06625 [Fimbriiglobus sp.]|nr:hypothetical protein [Fimbriiglobus sp.]
MTREPSRPFDTVFVEFDVQLDEWKPLSPEEAREVRRRLPPPWGTKGQPPTDPNLPAE